MHPHLLAVPLLRLPALQQMLQRLSWTLCRQQGPYRGLLPHCALRRQLPILLTQAYLRQPGPRPPRRQTPDGCHLPGAAVEGECRVRVLVSPLWVWKPLTCVPQQHPSSGWMLHHSHCSALRSAAVSPLHSMPMLRPLLLRLVWRPCGGRLTACEEQQLSGVQQGRLTNPRGRWCWDLCRKGLR
jgi:hypothetical protein